MRFSKSGRIASIIGAFCLLFTMQVAAVTVVQDEVEVAPLPERIDVVTEPGEASVNDVRFIMDNQECSPDTFEWVDSGISGRAAAKVGTLMRRIAAKRQVLCVTHLAQIAACGHTHLLVSKSVSAGRTYTAVDTLTEDARLQELARIMGGTVTDAALSAARELRLRAEEE